MGWVSPPSHFLRPHRNRHGPHQRRHPIQLEDISDGFYNVFVGPLRITLTTLPPLNHPPIVHHRDPGDPCGYVTAIGPIFCALTEIVTDLTNCLIQINWRPPAHCLDDIAAMAPSANHPLSRPGRPPWIRHHNRGPLGGTNCYVDEFLLLEQGGRKRRRRLCRILFYYVDGAFKPPDAGAGIWKKDPNSLKRLLKSNRALLTTKIVLGWLIDTVAGTIELPPHRLERLHKLLGAFSCTHCTWLLQARAPTPRQGIGVISWLQEQVNFSSDHLYLNAQFSTMQTTTSAGLRPTSARGDQTDGRFCSLSVSDVLPQRSMNTRKQRREDCSLCTC